MVDALQLDWFCLLGRDQTACSTDIQHQVIASNHYFEGWVSDVEWNAKMAVETLL
jgi:hypothetical protein